MKNITFILMLFLFVMCNGKSINKNSDFEGNGQNNINDTIKNLKLPFCSENLNYFKKNKKGYFIYDNNFILSKINGKYSKVFRAFSTKNMEILFLESKTDDDEHTEPRGMLFSFLDSVKKDSLLVYETIKWEGSLTKRFCINSDKTISVTEISEGYDTTNKGKDTLIKSNSRNNYYIREDGMFENLNWKGNYYFESVNKDSLKTSFKIGIKNLNNITVEYLSDDSDKEVYNNLKASLIDENKIMIVFDKDAEDMGFIYLDISDDKFYISGQPIYFINPGSDRESIKKY